MLRLLTAASLAAALVFTTGLRADDDKDKKAKKEVRARIVKVDPDKGTITLKMKKGDEEVEKTFKVAESIRYLDSTGKVAAVDIFKADDDVLVVEAEGKITRMKRDKNQTTALGKEREP
jgi:hypothetical protein